MKSFIDNILNNILGNFNYVIIGLLTASLLGNVLLCGRCFKKGVTFARVNVEQIVGSLAKGVIESGDYRTEEAIKQVTKEQLAKVDQVLIRIAEQEKLIILTSKAVIAGGVDITDQVEAIIKNQNNRVSK